MRPLTDRQTSVIIKLLTTTDMMLSEIAERMGCGHTTVRRVRDEFKCKRPDEYRDNFANIGNVGSTPHV